MKKILIIISVFLALSGCTKLEDLNVNVKDFTSVSGESLYNGATRQLINQLSNENVNSNVTLYWMQHLAATTYTDESRYDMTTRSIPVATWNAIYRQVLINYKSAYETFKVQPLAGITQARRDNQLAIVEIMSVFAWSYLVENFGDIPYTQALNYHFATPVYDDGLTIYKDLISRLNTAMSSLTLTEAGLPAGYDNIFGSTVAATTQWYRFANTLKLRMGLMLYDVDAGYSKTVVESAAPNVFIQGDVMMMHYLAAAPNQNQQYVDFIASGRSDYVVTSNLIDAMQPTVPIPENNFLNVTVTDPRLRFYAIPVIGSNPAVYKGGLQGRANSFVLNSHVNPIHLTPDRPWVIMDYTEAEFLLAEAKERGFNVPGTAESHYNNAVKSSIMYWGGTSAEADAYLAQPSVAYATAFPTWKQKIGTQAWLAYWLRGNTIWNSYRRLDYPRLLATPEYKQQINKVPVRLFYPIAEQTLNKTNYEAASAKIGGDSPLTKLFFDRELY
ncbi:MAG TPA: SusD/RagB family nutrient-binding outer membrane lipoprotein [Bacteroidales bacterium]|nr:SusD/RagB family nutrient-binding outer membrane lipoprotein [Bacteroidales bacterium]